MSAPCWPHPKKLLGAGSINSRAEIWESFLGNDNDRDFLLTGIKHGFNIVDNLDLQNNVEQQNYNSTLIHKQAVQKQILEEIEENRYQIVNEKPALISALGAIEKGEGKIRLIHDCSRPPSHALNDYVTERERFSYQTLKDAGDLINPGSYLCKIDLKSAYRYVCIHPSNYKFTGLKWTFDSDREPVYMVDTRLPFGSKLAPGIFNRISQLGH